MLEDVKTGIYSNKIALQPPTSSLRMPAAITFVDQIRELIIPQLLEEAKLSSIRKMLAYTLLNSAGSTGKFFPIQHK